MSIRNHPSNIYVIDFIDGNEISWEINEMLIKMR